MKMSEQHVRELHKSIWIRLGPDMEEVCEHCFVPDFDGSGMIIGSEEYPCRTLLSLAADVNEPLDLWAIKPEPKVKYGADVRFFKGRPYRIKESDG